MSHDAAAILARRPTLWRRMRDVLYRDVCLTEAERHLNLDCEDVLFDIGVAGPTICRGWLRASGEPSSWTGSPGCAPRASASRSGRWATGPSPWFTRAVERLNPRGRRLDLTGVLQKPVETETP